jgi:hypothetical protein
MFYMFKMILFVSTSNYLLKSFKFVIEQNHFIDLTIDSPIAINEQLHFSERKWLLSHMVMPIHNIPEPIIVAVFSPVVIDYFRKVIDNKQKKKTKIPTNKQNREMK